MLKERKPWLAGLLSLFCPGLGQLYNGSVYLAFFILLLNSGITLIVTKYYFEPLSSLIKGIVFIFLADIVFGLHAYWQAKFIGKAKMGLLHRWWIYLGFAVLLYGLPDGYGLFMPTRIMSFQIPSESMLPNLLIGDRLVADGWAYWKHEPQRGDIVVFDYPKDPSIKYVKRLIGVAGDVVELREGELYLNGKMVEQNRTDRPIVNEKGWEHTEFLENLDGVKHTIFRAQPMSNGNFGPVTVPEGKFFMMGDNRDRSSDSRVWGFVSRDQIIARMRYIYFSWDSEKGRIRKDRIGLPVN